MFAVPGWAVSASSLKAETVSSTAPAADNSDPAPTKKRKRPSEALVTSTNVADLWESVIEGKVVQKPKASNANAESKKKSKKQKGGTEDVNGHGSKHSEARQGGEKLQLEVEAPGQPEPEQDGLEAKPKKRKMKERRDRRKREREEEASRNGANEAQEASGDSHKQPQPQPKGSKKGIASAAPKLTPLQASMKEKLVSARFRHLNETLYTRPSAEAFSLFEDSPEMFQQYHEGFRRQADSWPSNPVDGYIADIKLRARQKPLSKDRTKAAQAVSPGGVAPLVRTNHVCTIADLGCGDAKLAETLQSEKKKLKLQILSYDLQSPSPLVTKADIANLSLEEGSVNVVIFCLALMGTNWLDFIEEAYRILHWKGELWITEIQSRFAPVREAKKGPVTPSVGNRKKAGVGGKKAKAEAEEPNEDELAVVVDGAEDKKQETDVSAFVEALRRRGFLLQGEPRSAVDMSNKMFVKMHFVKAAAPSVGKGAVAADKPEGVVGRKSGPKPVERDAESTLDEDKILKPCVYKIR